MSTTQGLLRSFNQIEDNPVLLDRSVTEPVFEGLNQTLSRFQGLALQYQKHHFVFFIFAKMLVFRFRIF